MRLIRGHPRHPRSPMNVEASMQALNSEFCILNSVIFAVERGTFLAQRSPA